MARTNVSYHITKAQWHTSQNPIGLVSDAIASNEAQLIKDNPTINPELIKTRIRIISEVVLPDA